MNKWDHGSIYGVFVIDNDFNNKTVTKWLFKIHSLDWSDRICIGIDSSNNKWINDAFALKPGSIGYCQPDIAYKDGNCIQKYGNGYKKDDIIIMIHNPIESTLTFGLLRGGIVERKEVMVKQENKTWYGGKKIIEIEKESDQFKRIKGGETTTYKLIKINDNKQYKMCVHLQGHGTSVELLSCDQYIVDNHKNDNTVNFIPVFSFAVKLETISPNNTTKGTEQSRGEA